MKNLIATTLITLALSGAAFAQTGTGSGDAAGSASGSAGTTGGAAAGTTNNNGGAAGTASGTTSGTATGTAAATGTTGTQGKSNENDTKFFTKLGDMASGFFGADNSVRSQDDVSKSYKALNAEQQTMMKEECQPVGAGGYGEQVTSLCGMLK